LKVKGTARDKNIVREKDNQPIERRDKGIRYVLAKGYETRILQPIAYRIPGYVSDTDTRWIRLGYISMEYLKKNKCR
jgi:hypothetical protein